MLRCGSESFESELTYRQNRYATLTGVQDVFQICERSSYELHRCVWECALTYCHSLGKLMIQSQSTTVSIEPAHISVFRDSLDKIKVLTHCFERSGWIRWCLVRKRTHNRSTPVSWGGTRFNTLKRYEITHTKIKCWEVSRVSGISAKLERRLKRENGREGRASAICVFVRRTGSG